jgi:hypothetical protein
MEFSLLFAVLMGVLALYGFLWWEGARGNAAECSRSLWDIALTAGTVGLFAGRIAAMVGDGVNPISNPADIIIVRAGVATGPAALVALMTIAALSRREVVLVADGLAAAVLAGLGGWHAGCLARDACLGTGSDLPWAYSLGGSTVTRHPVELYTALLFLAAGALVAWAKAYRRPPPLVPAGSALAVAGAVRLATERMRPSLAGGPDAWYWAALVVGLVVVGYAAVRHRAGKPVSFSAARIRSR